MIAADRLRSLSRLDVLDVLLLEVIERDRLLHVRYAGDLGLGHFDDLLREELSCELLGGGVGLFPAHHPIDPFVGDAPRFAIAAVLSEHIRH